MGSILINSISLVCPHQRVFFSMDHQVAVKLLWQRLSQMNAHPTSSQSRDQSSSLCGSVSPKPTSETFSTRQELQHHAYFSSMSLIPLVLLEVAALEAVAQETVFSTNFLQKWTVQVQRKTCSSLVQPIDPTFLTKL